MSGTRTLTFAREAGDELLGRGDRGAGAPVHADRLRPSRRRGPSTMLLGARTHGPFELQAEIAVQRRATSLIVELPASGARVNGLKLLDLEDATVETAVRIGLTTASGGSDPRLGSKWLRPTVAPRLLRSKN